MKKQHAAGSIRWEVFRLHRALVRGPQGHAGRVDHWTTPGISGVYFHGHAAPAVAGMDAQYL